MKTIMKTEEEIEERLKEIEKIIKYPLNIINIDENNRLRGYLQALHYVLGENGY